MGLVRGNHKSYTSKGLLVNTVVLVLALVIALYNYFLLTIKADRFSNTTTSRTIAFVASCNSRYYIVPLLFTLCLCSFFVSPHACGFALAPCPLAPARVSIWDGSDRSDSADLHWLVHFENYCCCRYNGCDSSCCPNC